MMPLEISCYAITAIASDGYLPLDSILAALWMREYHPGAYYNDSAAAHQNLIEAELPIERINNGHGWYYACSFCQADWVAAETKYWHKRSTQSQQIRYIKKGRLNLAQGKTKAYRMPLFLISPNDRLTWYLVADKNWLADRLDLITGIGKKRAYGYGWICDWQITEIDQDRSVWSDDRLMRSIPLADIPPDALADMRFSHYGLRPPYWHSANQMDLALPSIEGGVI